MFAAPDVFCARARRRRNASRPNVAALLRGLQSLYGNFGENYRPDHEVFAIRDRLSSVYEHGPLWLDLLVALGWFVATVLLGLG